MNATNTAAKEKKPITNYYHFNFGTSKLEAITSNSEKAEKTLNKYAKDNYKTDADSDSIELSNSEINFYLKNRNQPSLEQEHRYEMNKIKFINQQHKNNSIESKKAFFNSNIQKILKSKQLRASQSNGNDSLNGTGSRLSTPDGSSVSSISISKINIVKEKNRIKLQVEPTSKYPSSESNCSYIYNNTKQRILPILKGNTSVTPAPSVTYSISDIKTTKKKTTIITYANLFGRSGSHLSETNQIVSNSPTIEPLINRSNNPGIFFNYNENIVASSKLKPLSTGLRVTKQAINKTLIKNKLSNYAINPSNNTNILAPRSRNTIYYKEAK